jgi:hypothetical protein
VAPEGAWDTSRVDLNKLTLGDKIVAGTGIVLFIGLLAFPWHHIEISAFGFSASTNRTGLQSPNSFWGILAFLLVIAVVAVLILRRLTTVDLPEIPIAWNQAIFYGTIAVIALLFIKLVSETNYLGWGAWINLLLAAGMVYGGFLIWKQADAPAPGEPLA